MYRSKHKKSILVVTSTFPRWSNDTDPPFIMELSKRLVKAGFDVDVLAPHAFGTKKKEVMEGVNVYRYQYFFSKWQLLAYNGGVLANLKKNKLLYLLIPLFMFSQMCTQILLIKKNNYDLIHAHWLIPQGLISVIISKYLYKDGPRILCTLHGSDLFSFQSFLFDNIKKWVLNYSDSVTVVSEHLRKNCLQITDIEEKINVCSMGVDLLNTFKPLVNIKRNNNRILFVGRLVEEKNVMILLEAIHSILDKYPGLKLIIAGDGPEKGQLEETCRKLNIEHAVEFLGALNHNQLPELYSSSSIVVMSSKREGLGLVAIEAMGCECVIIAPSIPAMEDIIENGINGILVEPGDSVQIAKAIDNLLVDTETKDKISARARQSVIDKFDWGVIVNKYSDIIQSICEKT